MKKLELTFPYTVFTDGAARGRNGGGPAASGFVVYDRAGIIKTFATTIGTRTNNHAEYQGLIMALNWVLDSIPQDERCIHFKTDSELMAKQVNGEYVAKNMDLRGLLGLVHGRLSKLDAWKVEWVPRELNVEADAACREALKLNGVYERP